MPVASESLRDLSHQLRFLFFEMGISLSQKQVENAIDVAHSQQFIFNQPLESVRNRIARQAMMLLYRKRWQDELAREASGFDNFWLWLNSHQCQSLQLDLLWQWGTDSDSDTCNHPFNFREHLKFNPAFNSRFNLHWCAVYQKDALNSEYLKQLQRYFPALLQNWRHKMQEHQLNPDHYLPLPAHPGHWHDLWPRCSTMIDHRELVLIPNHQPVLPASTTNLLLPIHAADCIIELNDTPPASDEIQQLLAQHHHFENQLYVLNTISSFTPEKLPAVHLRQNPLSLLQNQQSLIPLDTFFALSPLNNKPLLVEIIEASRQNPLVYFRQYCQRLLLPQLALFVKEEVILPFQAKDCLFIIDHHLPQALVICRLDKALHQGRHVETLVNQFIGSNIDQHLSRWIKILHEHFTLPISMLWQNLLQIVQEFFVNNTQRKESFYAFESTLLHYYGRL